MTGPSVSLGVPIRIAGQPMLHAACQIWLGGLDQGVDMVWHPAIGENNPPASQYFVLQPSREAFVVTGVVK
jgi:hypothetical protein